MKKTIEECLSELDKTKEEIINILKKDFVDIKYQQCLSHVALSKEEVIKILEKDKLGETKEKL
jgi:uncharacterized protein YuzB (UPF0349 family)